MRILKQFQTKFRKKKFYAYVNCGEKKKNSIRQIKEVKWGYALSRYLLIRFINVTVGNSNTANILFTNLMEIQFLDCYLQRHPTKVLSTEESRPSR